VYCALCFSTVSFPQKKELEQKEDRAMHCRIRIQGQLDPSWQPSLEELHIVQEANGTSLLSGVLKDQAALYGVLLKIRSLSLTLLSLETSEEPHEDR
jgi:hypothetical protein